MTEDKMRMWERISKKMFCFHEWKSHAKTEEHHSSSLQQGTTVREVLICQKCGVIKQIQY